MWPTLAKSLGHGGQTLAVAATNYAGLQELEHLSDVLIEQVIYARARSYGHKYYLFPCLS